MSLRVIARRFAVALADTLPEEDDLRRVEEEVAAFADALERFPELRTYLLGPLMPQERKRKAADAVLASMDASPRCRDFVRLLVDRHRVGLASQIAEEFSAAVRERLGIVEAEVTSAHRLAQRQRDRIRKALARLVSGEVRASFQVDPSLLGGLRARVGSTIYDGTVRGRLERLRERLAKA